MKPRLIGLVLLSFLAVFGLPRCFASEQEELVAQELKLLSGIWRPVSAENNGYKASEADFEGERWIRDADGKWVMQRDGKTVVGWRVKRIDPTKAPKEIDLEVTLGTYQGVVYQGIYDLTDDTLRICFCLPDRDGRPREFTGRKGTIYALSSFKRVRD